MDTQEKLAKIEAQMEALRDRQRPIVVKLQKLDKQHQRLIETLAAEIDISTEEGLRKLVEIGWSNGRGSSVGSRRIDEYFQSIDPAIHGHQWHTREKETIAIPSIKLTRGQKVRDLSVGLAGLVERLGVDTVDLFERTLSEDGSYMIEVGPDEARLVVWRYHRREVILTGSLEQVLARAARDHWYQDEDL